MSTDPRYSEFPGRGRFVLWTLFVALSALLARAVYLQYYERAFLRDEGVARYQRVIQIPAHRGMVVDRNGEPLAISTPVDSVWANPREAMLARDALGVVAGLLQINADELYRMLAERASREFVYLKRHVDPEVAKRVMALKAPGINLQREYRRYYPMGEVAAQVIGFTGIDDQGQEGLELAFDDWLSGQSGAKRVIKDRLGRVVEDVERLRAPRPGKLLRLSLDRRIQYLAYRELKAAVHRHGARSGSIVVLDARRGEVLAMVNQPSFNPNNRAGLRPARTRNRAVTDVFEPGSTVKPFTVAAALKSGTVTPHTLISTSPGWYMVRGHTIQDVHDYGTLSVAKVISKSSNVGASKIALGMPAEALWEAFARVGFGALTGSGFPGESPGVVTDFTHWRKVERATLSFGYGLSVTPLQLARAYAVLANDGLAPTVSFVVSDPPQTVRRVLPEHVVRQVREMMEAVVSDQGTAPAAAVAGYRVAGKTGTVYKSTSGGYAQHRYVSVFAGMAPAAQPELVVVVMVNEPTRGGHYGGVVAAPVFSRVMSGALRLLDITPDALPADVPTLQVHSAELEGAA
jgi:cell division protein FtsI (penicillin-binding protein 3)